MPSVTWPAADWILRHCLPGCICRVAARLVPVKFMFASNECAHCTCVLCSCATNLASVLNVALAVVREQGYMCSLWSLRHTLAVFDTLPAWCDRGQFSGGDNFC